jgi:hypothetical protein
MVDQLSIWTVVGVEKRGIDRLGIWVDAISEQTAIPDKPEYII